jgi:hypothetical protein
MVRVHRLSKTRDLIRACPCDTWPFIGLSAVFTPEIPQKDLTSSIGASDRGWAKARQVQSGVVGVTLRRGQRRDGGSLRSCRGFTLTLVCARPHNLVTSDSEWIPAHLLDTVRPPDTYQIYANDIVGTVVTRPAGTSVRARQVLRTWQTHRAWPGRERAQSRTDSAGLPPRPCRGADRDPSRG